MNKFNLITVSLLCLCFSLPSHALEFRALVVAEHAGPDIIFRYTLVNNGDGKMKEFAIGSVPVFSYDTGAAVAPAKGTLTQLPTGTTYGNRTNGRWTSVHIADPASLISPTGWSAWISNRRGTDAFAITWDVPSPVEGVPIKGTGADAGQTLTGFSVRVPKIPIITKNVVLTEPLPGVSNLAKAAEISARMASKPARIGSLEPYLTGSFEVVVWYGGSLQEWDNPRTDRQIFAVIEKQDKLPPTLSVALTPGTMPVGSTLLPVTAAITVKDNYDPMPEMKLESITANQTLSSGDISDAAFGTDDRSFKLKPVSGRIYTVTYSATDGSGNKATAAATVVVK